MVLAELRVTISSRYRFRFANLKMGAGPTELK